MAHHLTDNVQEFPKAECRVSVFYHTIQCLLELSTSQTANEINMVSLF